MPRTFTKEQKAKLREELSVDSHGKFNRILAKLQDRLDPFNVGKRVLTANAMYFEEVAKIIKSLTSRYRFNFFIKLYDKQENNCFYVDFFDDILDDYLDEIVLKRLTLPVYNNGEQVIIIDFNGVVADLTKQVNDYLNTLEEEPDEAK